MGQSQEISFNPISRFKELLARAEKSGIKLPNSFTLATVDNRGQPSQRVVLLKDVDERGFVYYTNLRSRKSREIAGNQKVALCFYWPALDEQVRVEGAATQVSDAEADAYFATRPRGSQIGAWASDQSEPMESRDELLARVERFNAKFGDGPVQRPGHWSGFCVVPQVIEFWKNCDDRLHVRNLYRRALDSTGKPSGTWSVGLLQP